MEKIDFKKTRKELYGPGARPILVQIPRMNFLALDGQGDPNRPAFAQGVEALYALAYGIKMRPKSHPVPPDWQDYVVPPLEGLWDTTDGLPYDRLDKDKLRWRLLIMQPHFVTQELFREVQREVMGKKDNPDLPRVEWISLEEGPCVQILHTGSYDDEPVTMDRMEDFAHQQGLGTDPSRHHEIYISDPRRTPPEKLKTILRLPVHPLDEGMSK